MRKTHKPRKSTKKLTRMQRIRIELYRVTWLK